MMVFKAVSYPIVVSVPNKSLSIVPGKPTMGKLYSLAKIRAPVSVPSPPMQATVSYSAACCAAISVASPRPCVKYTVVR